MCAENGRRLLEIAAAAAAGACGSAAAVVSRARYSAFEREVGHFAAAAAAASGGIRASN